ncbi:hypothetical protein Wildcat_26 [Mycobacterium phage Wildcat]|uniref:Terminase large subunit n=4 Tax=Mycobacterium virus Wildcat TaxID=1993859 RepID=Q19Y34_9CAUD|nr:hypothetical protein Wildcat_26 [Mycobacterium phage Wildcat]AJD82098.1 terminase large subunit [Mycobacterium phage Cosmo]AQT25698.1 terminase large subunit [Mycobacterium phage EniyanLRS]QGJ89916.1 terminase large subunit [Mycobacterium phage MaryV]WKR36036.1 terminase [Mycobacterium phage Azrael100]ABE67631.1 hypothetical protein Wildcat_26 [Mycobacterium phage Wildcat]
MPRGQSPREGFSLGNDDGVNVVVGERYGYQRPPEGHCFIPPYTTSLGDKAMWFLHQVGFELDPWQEFVLRNMLNLDAQGHWAASEALLLVPRQNGKTAIIEARELVGLYVVCDKLCIHTAVLFNAARESFYRLKARIENNETLNKITRFRSGNDNMSIEVKPKKESRHPNAGGRVIYMARGTAVARGFSADVIVLDEAFALDEASIAAIDYATSARANPFIIYASSTGLEDSTELEKLHDRGMRQDPDMLFMEWCATTRDLDDEENYYRSNPALGYRISIERIRKERNRHSDKTFGRERLGLWNDNAFNAVIPADQWKSLCLCHGTVHDEHRVEGAEAGWSRIVTPTVVAIDSAPDSSLTTISWAGKNQDGQVQIEILQEASGVGWAVEFVAMLYDPQRVETPPPLAVVVQAGATAGQLIPELEALGIEVIPFGLRDACDACKYFYDRANDRRLAHLGDVSLASALGGATRIYTGRAGGTKEEPEYRTWYWGRRDTTVNITGLVSCTYAAWGLNKFEAKVLATQEPWQRTEQGSWIW